MLQMIVMNKSSNKTIGLVEIYLKGYPYKRNFPFKVSTVPYPYIKKEDVSLHQYACDFHVFRDVVEGYLDYIMEELIEGNLWRLYFGMGEIRIKKLKHKFLIDVVSMKGMEAPPKQYKRILTPDDYFLGARWHRSTVNVKWKYNWMFKLARPIFRECYKRINNNNNHIYKYQDA